MFSDGFKTAVEAISAASVRHRLLPETNNDGEDGGGGAGRGKVSSSPQMGSDSLLSLPIPDLMRKWVDRNPTELDPARYGVCVVVAQPQVWRGGATLLRS